MSSVGGINGGINGGLNDRINDRINGRINDRINLSDTELLILSEISKNTSVTIHELVEITGFSAPTVNRALKVLQQNNIITRVGAKKNGYWQIME